MSGPGADSWGFGSGVPAGSPGAGAGGGGSGGARLPRPSSAEHLAHGARFGPFSIVGELGRGGMGAVYRAVEVASGRPVALKVIAGEGAGEGHRLERLRREGELTAALRHPHIVGIHGAGEVAGRAYLAYELIEGATTLTSLLERGARAEALRLIAEAARGLGHAHAHGVVHRDVKPDNVLIDSSGRARVADFGLAWSEQLEALTKTGALVGTPTHMAPEQLAKDVGPIGPPTDVWALGVMLYRALTGELPFGGGSLYELYAQLNAASPIPPRKHDPTISLDLQAVCLKCLTRLPGERYPDADAFAEDLEAALASRPVSASTTRWSAIRYLRRGRAGALLSLVAGALLVTGALAALIVRRQDQALVRAALELRQLSAEVQRSGGAAALEAALARADPSLAAERLQGHLALAALPAERVEDWERALRHAQAASALAAERPESRAAAERAAGLALLGLERPAEAAEAFARAAAAGDPAARLLAARAHLAAGAARPAEELCRAVLDQAPTQPEALELLVRARLARRLPLEAEQALERLAALGPGPTVDLLRAELEVARGADRVTALERAARAAPKVWAPRIALAEHLLLDLADPPRAAEALDLGEDVPGSREAARLRRLCAALLADGGPDLAALAGAAPSWRVAAARWLTAEAARDLRFVAREADPAFVTSPGALASDARRARARARLEAALAVAPDTPEGRRAGGAAWRVLAELAPAGSPERAAACARATEALPGDPRVAALRAADLLARGEAAAAVEALAASSGDPRALRLRGEALLRAGRAGQAVAPLDALVRSWADGAVPDPGDAATLRLLAEALVASGRPEEAAPVRERAERLTGSRRAEAQALFESAHERLYERKLLGEDAVEAFERVLALDPAHVEAVYYRGKAMFVLPGRELDGLRGMAAGAMRAPRLLAEMLSSMRSLEQAGLFVRGGGVRGLYEDIRLGDVPVDRMLRAILLTVLSELGKSSPEEEDGTRMALEALLERDPACVAAWTLRGALSRRRGWHRHAARCLEVAAEAAPDCAATLFYRTLLLARAGAPPERIADDLLRVRHLGWTPWGDEGWKLELYPELRAYADHPKVGKVLATH